jgi:hypothetical protein
MANNLKKKLKSTLLCIRFPFLYPVNRFTGLHYNNYKIRSKIADITKEYKVFEVLPEEYKDERVVNSGDFWYFRKTGRIVTYWKNWWAPIVRWILIIYHDYILQALHFIPSYTEFDMWDCPEVWCENFGIEWAKDLRKGLIKEYGFKSLFKYRILQIKEKWGVFTWYYPPEKLKHIESKYVERSRSICSRCGKPATKVTPQECWILYYCDECAPEYAEPIQQETTI